MKKPKYQEMAISAIRADKEIQSRVDTDLTVAKNYSDALLDGATFPAVVVFYDGKVYWLADGFTRLEAHKRATRRSILADVREGTRRDAILYSVSANLTMGMHPTQADREKGAMMLIRDPEFFNYCDTEISKRSGASRNRVTVLRKAYCEEHGIDLPSTIITMNRGRPTPFQVNREALSDAARRRSAKKTKLRQEAIPREMAGASAVAAASVEHNPTLAKIPHLGSVRPTRTISVPDDPRLAAEVLRNHFQGERLSALIEALRQE